ncbi:OadG family transporter subunit [Hydrogenimonas urashimensis]|uniref:OadG family transporter subunit n=1 Tax=Hydrogenimonas urashimensis TaxID=2740515 RepID=UPI001916376A|nr:OadG family transporter subunit [Hydrogenimonas urashimensis]
MEDMVAESTKYTVLGMGIVFLFLYVLVLVLRLQKNLITRYFIENESAPVPLRQPETVHEDERGRKRKVAAMIAAIHHYKRSKETT